MEAKARKEDMSMAKTAKVEMSVQADAPVMSVEAKAFKQDMSVGKADKTLSVGGKASKVMSV